MIPNCSGVYTITNKVNGKIYVGSSTNMPDRFVCHISGLNCEKHDNTHLQNSWNKHGKEAFELEPVLYCEPHNTLFYEEQVFQILVSQIGRENLYNINEDFIRGNPSFAGRKHSEETKAKMSSAQQGKRRSNETRAKISESKRNPSKETREKLSLANKGKKRGAQTQEHRDKISISTKGVKKSPRTQEHRDNHAAALRGRKRPEEMVRRVADKNRGKKRSDETRAKMSAASRLRHQK